MNSFFCVVKQGDKYLQSWPKQNVLNCLFVDSKVAFYTRLSIKTTPAFIMLVIVLNIAFPALFSWPVTATFSFFLLGLPIQGLYWLGKRSQKLLPKQLLPWYTAIHKKLNGNNGKQALILHHPRYLDLAHLLTRAFKLGGDQFLQRHELI